MENNKNKPILHGAEIVIRKKNPSRKDLCLILLVRWGNHCYFPKGHIEKDENPLICALRETKEETGISKDSLQMENQKPIVIAYKLNQNNKES